MNPISANTSAAHLPRFQGAYHVNAKLNDSLHTEAAKKAGENYGVTSDKAFWEAVSDPNATSSSKTVLGTRFFQIYYHWLAVLTGDSSLEIVRETADSPVPKDRFFGHTEADGGYTVLTGQDNTDFRKETEAKYKGSTESNKGSLFDYRYDNFASYLKLHGINPVEVEAKGQKVAVNA